MANIQMNKLRNEQCWPLFVLIFANIIQITELYLGYDGWCVTSALHEIAHDSLHFFSAKIFPQFFFYEFVYVKKIICDN